MRISVPHDSRCPGIETTVQQSIDVPSLSKDQFTRLHNCAKKGFVLGRGHVSEILNALAEKHGLMAPVLAWRTYSAINVEHDVFDPESPIHDALLVEDLLNLSDVRYKFQLSQRAPGRYREQASSRRGNTLTLYGWEDEHPETLRKEIITRLNRIPHFVESTKQLSAIVAEKPHVEVYSKTY